MSQRKRAVEPIEDNITDATLVSSAMSSVPQTEQVTLHQEMKGEPKSSFTMSRDMQKALLLLGLQSYKESKVAAANEGKKAIDEQLRNDLELVEELKAHILAGEF